MSFVRYMAFLRTPCKIAEFHSSRILNAEPMKKKKSDTMIVAMRIQRKVKKIEKELKKLDKKGKILKPIIEIEGDFEVIKNLEERKRALPKPTEEENDYVIKLRKEWVRYSWKQNIIEQSNYKILMGHQMNALEELKECSEELYQAAIETDWVNFPIKSKGPVSGFLDEYESPDGDMKDCTLNYKYDIEIDKRLLVKSSRK